MTMRKEGQKTTPSQWACPRGPLGWVFGWLMAAGNANLNDLAVDALEPKWGESILEIGFGPGVALAEVARRIGNGFVAGVDPSETMIKQATRRLRALVASGRVELRRGTISSLPFESARFDRVLSVNTIYFWPAPRLDLIEVRRVLRLGGHLVLGFRAAAGQEVVLQLQGAPPAPPLVEIGEWLRDAGFDDLRTRTREVKFGPRKMTGVIVTARAA